MKRSNPAHEVTVLERHRPGETFGFGVVFSDATMDTLRDADPETHRRICERFFHWDDIDIHFAGHRLTSTGHGFAGCGRGALLKILAERAEELGVNLRFETDVPDPRSLAAEADLLVGADGINSRVRDAWRDHFRPSTDIRPNRFTWLGTSYPFDAFTFYFKRNAHGLWRIHAYRYEEGHSTFIAECTDATWRGAGLDTADESSTIAYLEDVFAEELRSHRLVGNRSVWRQFETVTNARWQHENVVLIGDAAHTAHFSVGSGTKLAMEDAVELAKALARYDRVSEALAAYEAERRPAVESLQRAAQVSLEWFENTERYTDLPPPTFGFSLLTRSLRISHGNLKMRDPAFVARVDRFYHESECRRRNEPVKATPPPPLFEPYVLRGLRLDNRIVMSPMCMYVADDGAVSDWHLVHLGSRAVGGAGLILAEMTDVSRDGRISPGCAGMYKTEHVTAWRRITDFIHRHSRAKVGLQLGHAGRKGSTQRLWERPDEPLDDGNWPLISASALPYLPESQVPREMTEADMREVTSAFVRATRLADEAGFDLLELHLAHGYLLASFLSPLTNRRTDAYGGTLENRLRYPLSVFRAVREAWPDEKPISVRISATDWHPDGNDGDDAVAIAAHLKRAGVDIIDVSTGQTDPASAPRYGRLYQTPFSERIRMEVDVPTMTVGGISSYEDVNSILVAGRADLCVIARAHLFDPYWTRHAAYELEHPLEWPDPYKAIRDYTFRFR